MSNSSTSPLQSKIKDFLESATSSNLPTDISFNLELGIMSEENPLTFSELRKIQKNEKRQDELSELDENFFFKVGNYLEMKEDTDMREYKSAKRVFEKIIGLRQEKITKNARLATKSKVKGSDLDMLPREQELFREMKQLFNGFSEKVEGAVNGDSPDVEIEEEPEVEDVEEEEDGDSDYEKVKIIAEVPEFMGTDLESYGPFEEGEKVEIPEDNAEILVNRGNAEAIN